ncbi:MAG TPA: sigma-70 family RNA polymerase sigma factor [Myxococcales bacterium]|jgi:RNA polymerase sigma-70 factor (ECF subfamily)
MSEALGVPAQEDGWLRRFHAGEAEALEECYREQYEVVDGAVGRLLRGADRETVVHEVFYRVVSDARFRQAFHGGSLGAWLGTVARNLATDHLRAQQRHRGVSLEEAGELPETTAADGGVEAAEARMLIDRFRAEVLPAKWAGVFQARFIEQRDQRDAARQLGMARTTLAYQELRIRSLLRKFLLKGGAP